LRKKGFSVFVKHRHRRLSLRKALGSLESAMAFATEVRRMRFHDRNDIFVVCEESGEVFPLAPTVEVEPVAAQPATLGPESGPRLRKTSSSATPVTEESLRPAVAAGGGGRRET
jgi:hypothetical protein